MQFNPNSDNQNLYRNVYRVNKSYSYSYKHLSSLVDWYETQRERSKYLTFLVVTLSYDSDSQHDPDNITKLIRYLKRAYTLKGAEKIDLSSVWRLEYRPSNTFTPKSAARGYHYHLVLCWDRNKKCDSEQLKNLIEKKWSKLAGENNVFISKTHQMPSWIEKDNNVRNDDTTSTDSVFHHLSYLAKSDPKQALPKDYKGDGFKTSRR